MLNPGRVTARFSRCIPSFGREPAARRMRFTFSPPLRGHALTVLLIRLSDSPRGALRQHGRATVTSVCCTECTCTVVGTRDYPSLTAHESRECPTPGFEILYVYFCPPPTTRRESYAPATNAAADTVD